MSTPIRRNLVLSITSLTMGLVLGCSASETTNTLAPGSGGSKATGGQTGTNGGANAGGPTGSGGASSTGSNSAAAGAPTGCAQDAPCTGLGQCTPAPPSTLCRCNGGKYSCT